MARSTSDGERPDPPSRDRGSVAAYSAINAEAAGVPADTTRSDMLHAIDGRLAELSQLINEHHGAGAESPRDAMLTEAANHLVALRGQVETARSPLQLASLRVAMVGAVQSASTAMTTAAGSSTQLQAARLYDTRMTAAERGMAEISRRDDALFASADGRAEQLGLDIGFFRTQRSLLEAEAEAARRRGDRFGAIVPEGLLAHNTANLWEDIADRSGSPEDRKKAEEGRKLAEEADRRVREAAQAEAERAAAGREFASDADRERWIAHDADQRFHRYQDRVDTLHQAGPQLDERRTKLAARDAVFADELGTAAPASQPEHAEGGLAASLPASVRDAAKEAGRTLAQDTSHAGTDEEPKVPAASPVNIAATRGAPGGSVTL